MERGEGVSKGFDQVMREMLERGHATYADLEKPELWFMKIAEIEQRVANLEARDGIAKPPVGENS